jgi:6-phosphofructo-2-kinase/fructose-2,6-biphosphatase
MKLYLSRHGESEYNQKKLLGGNSGLSTRGIKYSSQLFNFINKVSIDSKLNSISNSKC